jgi:hypothetical protein
MAKWVKPNLNTKFHIDFDWWKKSGRDFRVFLRGNLCPECQQTFRASLDTEEIDWIDPDTAEVKRVDGLWQALRTHCSKQPDYITTETPLVTAILRTFLANDNTPLSAIELQQQIGKKTSDLILRTIGRYKVYDGIRPVAPKPRKKGPQD